ncbi:MAG: TIGR01777 family oxidoreductase [Brachybacterium tyrofermentans]|uniref:TIGR01777 family oxidoreductase n=1 Tax=Brachybacterium tyrofermentans TaxID=47848 RepID=UPI00186746D5|nr:TIGR01777 family oxidoreductase [Brachybacterium tyrofermentans]
MKIETTHRIPFPQAEVLAWHERPGALVRLTPPGLATPDDPTAGGLQVGRVVGTRLGPSALPSLLRPHWILRHREHQRDVEGEARFVDQQVRGPWRTWSHEHRLLSDPGSEGGTLVRDTLEVELPARLQRLEPLLGPQMQRVFRFRDRQLREDLAFHARYADQPRRTIALTGSSGLIGTQLAALLETGGHTVRRMIREEDVGPDEISWDPQSGRLDPADLEGVDVVIHLAGRSIATRWTHSARGEIRSSRVHGSALIARTLANMDNGPSALVQASAIGLYGPRRPGELLTEADPGGEGFLADLVREWEHAAHAATEAGIRTAFVRTSLVLSDGGGPLLPQLPMFLAGVGGRLTSADAMTSWITLDDIVRVYAHAALSTDVHGPLNAVAPQPVTAGQFARTLGAALHRPAVVPVPAFGPKLLLGADGADELIQADQNVSDARLQASGFRAAHTTLEQALQHVLWR